MKKFFKNNLGKNRKGITVALGVTTIGIVASIALVMGVALCL